MKKQTLKILVICYLLAILPGCEDFLDAKPDKALVVPNALSDLENLLDNVVQVMNQDPALGTISGDEVVISAQGWAGLSNPIERNAYLWKEEVYEGRIFGDWNFPFQQIFYANVVLKELEDFDPKIKSSQEWKTLKGHAHFKRSMAYYQLSQHFIPPFDPDRDSSYGLPLRSVSSVVENPARSSVWETYDFMISDLLEAIEWLPATEPIQTRPSINSAKALLARIYLLQFDFSKALELAEEIIENSQGLIHYGDLDPKLAISFPRSGNREILYWSRMISYASLISTLNTINPEILSQYQEGDLRAKLFFVERPSGAINFRGNYTGNNSYFSGIALNEIYLIAAECHAKLGNLQLSLNLLNELLAHRWEIGAYEPIETQDQNALLKMIYLERKKELLMRGLRWSDLRRLNLQPEFEQQLSKSLDGDEYSLPPNDVRFTLPFPEIEVERNGFPQNPRN